MFKQETLARWQDRAEGNRQEIAKLEVALARARYEMEIIQRLLAKTPDPESRDTWRIQADVQQMFVASDEDHLAEAQEDLALCQAMIAEIEADLAQNGA